MKARTKFLIKIDIGCGLNKKDGFIGIDKDPNVGADYVIDLEHQKIPLPDNSVPGVHSNHTFEHLHNIFHVMSEIYRVCIPGAIVNIYVPHYRYEGAFAAPDHVRYFTPSSFDYFDKGQDNRWTNSHNPIDVNFKVLKVETIRGKIRFWKPYALHFKLDVIKGEKEGKGA